MNIKFGLKSKLTLITVFALFLLVQHLLTLPNVQNAIAMATTVKPETFTELYFTDHLSLPNAIIRWEQYSYSFTLHNLEYKLTDYPYEVYIERDGTKILLASGSATLEHDQYATISGEFGPLKNLRTRVVVELLQNHQKIHFWMEAI